MRLIFACITVALLKVAQLTARTHTAKGSIGIAASIEWELRK